MNAKELFRKELNPADCWSEQTISFDFNDVTEFAERYLEHKLKLLGIGDVVKPFYCKTKRCDKTKTKQCDECALQELNDMLKWKKLN
jgi:hypothetical protein